MKPLVSVIVPVHNVGKYLGICFDSILASSLTELEIIAIDDGSSDGSAELLDEYALKDRRIKVIHQRNVGAGPARNHGMSLACGKYLAFVDPDDFVARDQFEALVKVAEETEADIVGSGFSRYDESGSRRIGETRIKWRVKDLPRVFSSKDAADRLFATFLPAPWNKLFRREFVQGHELKFQSLPRSNDLCFSFTALALAERLTVVDETYYCYRVGRTGGAQNSSAARPTCVIEAYAALRENLSNEGLLDTFAKGFVRMAASSFCYTLSMIDDKNLAREFHARLMTRDVEEMLNLTTLTRGDFGTDLAQYCRYKALIAKADFAQLMRVIEGKSRREAILARVRRWFG